MTFKILLKSIENIHNLKVKLDSVFYSLTAIIVIRTFLEFLFEPSKSITKFPSFYFSLVDYIHIYFSWICVYFIMVIILNSFVKKNFFDTVKVVLISFPLIIIVPIIDGIIKSDINISYQSDFKTFLNTFIMLFNPLEKINHISIGVRIEVFLVVLFSTIYVLIIKKNIFKSILTGLSIYAGIYFFGYLPAIYVFFIKKDIYEIVTNSVLPVQSGVHFNALMYIPIIIVVCLYLFMQLDKKWRNTIINFIRIERMTIYLGIYIFSLILSFKNSLIGLEIFNLYDMLKIVSGLLSIICIFIFSTIINDLNDIECDRISNFNRPLVKYTDINENIESLKNIVLIFGILFAIIVNEHFLFGILALIALSYIYSVPPFRVKTILGLGHIVIATIAGTTALLGSIVVSSNLAYQNIDKNFLWSIVMFIFVASNFKDIKDIVGDKKDGVTTIGTILGEKKAFVLIKILICITLLLILNVLKLQMLQGFLIYVVFLILIINIKKSEKIILCLQGIGFLILLFNVFSR